MLVNFMGYESYLAVRAAMMVRKCGHYAMSRYCAKRGINMRLFMLALRLERGDV